MYKTADDVLNKKYTPKNTTEKLEHKKPVQTIILDRFVKDRKGKIGKAVEVKIKKGAGVVLTSIKTSDEHLFHDKGDEYVFDASTARFAVKDVITPEQLDEIDRLDKEDIPMAVATAVGEYQGDHKESFDVTMEFMASGAIFNKVMDGEGNVLFELEYDGVAIEFKADKTLKESITDGLRHIKKVLGLQKVKVTVFAGPDFMDWIHNKAKTEELFKNNQAKEVTDDGQNILVIHGQRFEEYISTYEDMNGNEKEFVPANECVFLPEGSNIFKLRYSRANDTKASGMQPKLYFGAVEELTGGKGWEVRSECRPLIFNSRPEATPKGKIIT